jgi:hypothetical protein
MQCPLVPVTSLAREYKVQLEGLPVINLLAPARCLIVVVHRSAHGRTGIETSNFSLC